MDREFAEPPNFEFIAANLISLNALFTGKLANLAAKRRFTHTTTVAQVAVAAVARPSLSPES